MSNTFREKPKPAVTEEEVVEPKKEHTSTSTKRKRKGGLARFLSIIFSGTFLSNDKALQHVPFIVFLAVIAIFYIANGYYADDKIREVNKITNQLKELRSEYISTKSDLMFVSKQSQVAKAVDSMGIKEPIQPPIKIEIDSNYQVTKK